MVIFLFVAMAKVDGEMPFEVFLGRLLRTGGV